MHFMMMLELTVMYSLSPSCGCYWPPCALAPRELCKPLCSSLQSRIAKLSCCTSWHPTGYWEHKGAKGSGELCASMNHFYHVSSQLQKLLLWEKKAPFSHVRLNKVFSVCQRNSVSGLNRTLQKVDSQNCGYMRWHLGKKEIFLTSMALILNTFFNLNQLKILYVTVDFNIIFGSKKHSDLFC